MYLVGFFSYVVNHTNHTVEWKNNNATKTKTMDLLVKGDYMYIIELSVHLLMEFNCNLRMHLPLWWRTKDGVRTSSHKHVELSLYS